jgi:type I restriction enzyme M protein
LSPRGTRAGNATGARASRGASRAAATATEGTDPEDPDEYKAASIFWVPREARWSHLKAQAPQPTIGRTVDDAMDAIERENPTLKGVLPKDFARPGLMFASIHAAA